MQPLLDYLNEVFFGLESGDFVSSLEKALIFLFVWGIVFYLIVTG